MPDWEVREVDRGGGRADVVVINGSGQEHSVLRADIPLGAFRLGPALGSEFAAVGVTEGIYWTPTVLYFDPARVPDDVTRQQALAVLSAHDPDAPAPPDPYIDTLVALETEAQLIIDTNGNVSTQARAFCQAFLTWAANDVPR